MTNTTTTAKTNRYPTSCNRCNDRLEPGEGVFIGRMVGGTRRWLYECPEGTCDTARLRPRRDAETHRCLVHGPADDECLGDRCLTGDHLARLRTLPICSRHGGPVDTDGCWECNMERDEAARDREDGMISARKHGLI